MSNEDLLKKSPSSIWNEGTVLRRWRWIGHVLRMDPVADPGFVERGDGEWPKTMRGWSVGVPSPLGWGIKRGYAPLQKKF